MALTGCPASVAGSHDYGPFRLSINESFVVAETHALPLTQLGYQAALTFLDRIGRSPTTTVVRVAAHDEQRARAIIDRYGDKRTSSSRTRPVSP